MIRAHVADDHLSFTTAVSLVIEPDPDDERDRREPMILRLGRGWESCWEPLVPGVVTEPTMRLDPESARALMQALLDHFHRGEDTRAMRRDYEGICARLDALAGAVGGLAERLAPEPA